MPSIPSGATTPLRSVGNTLVGFESEAPMSNEIDVKSIIKQLVERYPKAFFMLGKDRKPLKVGIFHDIVADLGEAMSESELSLALGSYTNNSGYLSALKDGADRIDLNGDVSGSV